MVPHGFGVTDAYQEQIVNTENQIDVISKAMLGITVSKPAATITNSIPSAKRTSIRLFGIMISNRPGTRNIDTPEKQSLNKEELGNIKRRIHKSMADYWMGQYR